ncbi:hypothetical protein Psfp_03956 [Pelotomaculum sp. FP]|uniref:hypothetical protein n=1 Tax=Pelotomaculum sp. FP TaxID=261474 RepID=UPI001065FC6D|nr:hypothetical protein [Pelotomaculum sp. FP]TEB11497.1 hypothetical protein Psfp_03956 [Pelotomaculum sp. FP]
MRRFIYSKVEQFHYEDIKEKIEEIKDAFDRYLDSYPVKTSQSKHGIMGPVGKILQEIKKGKWDVEGLSGYAVNIHLHNPKTKGRISENARAALEEGIEKLLSLIREESIAAQDRILELVDYGLYYRRRKKSLAWLESVKREWVEFLKEKYSTWENLVKAWGEKPKKGIQDIESIGYPSKRVYAEAKDQKKADMGEFIKQAELKGYDLDDEEE